MKIIKKQVFLNFDPPAEWETDPVLFVIHQLLDERPAIIKLAAPCFPKAVTDEIAAMGRDGMTVEQIVRAAIYKQYRRLSYADLAEHTVDSIKGRQFMKLTYGQYFSAQTLQENIARLTPEVWAAILTAVTQIGVDLGVDDGQKLRSDATVIETNIHYPTEVSLLWDSVRVSCRLLERLTHQSTGFAFRDYRTGAKKLLFKIVNCPDKTARKKLFQQMLKLNQTCINQVETTLELAAQRRLPMDKILFELCQLRPRMIKVQEMTIRQQINGEKIPVKDKIFSLFEDHTDCIVKGQRDASFGHKVNFATGQSNLIFDCHLELGNWSEKSVLAPLLERVTATFKFVPRDLATDGGQASLSNLNKAIGLGIKNVVFGKTVGSLKNVTTSPAMETRLKKWRAGMEAVISNFKRGLRAVRCPWKGWDGFQQFVLLNTTVFNLKVIATGLLAQL